MDSLKITTRQQGPDGALLSETTLEYPASLPNELANLLNLTTTLHTVLVAVRAALAKAVVTGGAPEVVAELGRLEAGLSALVGQSVQGTAAVTKK